MSDEQEKPASGERSQPPRTGDIVKHGPTGETWTVAYYDGRDLVPCGWPCTFAKVEHCTIVERATDEEHWKLVADLCAMPGNEYDPRRSWAQRYRETAVSGMPGGRV